jgi:hypothetical protein
LCWSHVCVRHWQYKGLILCPEYNGSACFHVPCIHVPCTHVPCIHPIPRADLTPVMSPPKPSSPPLLAPYPPATSCVLLLIGSVAPPLHPAPRADSTPVCPTSIAIQSSSPRTLFPPTALAPPPFPSPVLECTQRMYTHTKMKPLGGFSPLC